MPGIEVPRDRDGTFEPQIAKNRQPVVVLSLYVKSLITGGDLSALRGDRLRPTAHPQLSRTHNFT